MRIVVTGSKGMLGYDLVRKLKKDNDVVEIDIGVCDICDKSVIGFLVERKPEFVFHLAAFTDVDKAESEREKVLRINVSGTENIVTLCKRLDIPIVFLSTDYVFDGSKVTPYNEHDKRSPINFYGETKVKGEKIVIDMLEKFFIVRTSWLFGQNGKNFVKTIISLSERNESINVVDDQYGSPTYTVDLSVSLAMFLRSEKYGIYNITNRNSCSWFGFAQKIISFSGKQTEIIPSKSKDIKRQARRPHNSVLDNSFFEKNFDHRMPEWEEALGRYMSDERNQLADNS